MSRSALYVLGCFFGGLVLSLGLLWFRRYISQEAWDGAVIRVETRASGSGKDCIRVHYARLDGHSGVLTLDTASYSKLFGELRPGDRLIKTPGDPMPRRCTPFENRP